jgi:hypothetical protein
VRVGGVSRAVLFETVRIFQGDLNKLEAHELLLGRPAGTFLVRFSSGKPGSLALSFVMADGEVRHARICNSAVETGTGDEASGSFYIEGQRTRECVRLFHTVVRRIREGSLFFGERTRRPLLEDGCARVTVFVIMKMMSCHASINFYTVQGRPIAYVCD